MRYSDQHIHCSCSFDAEGSLHDMTAAAKGEGMAMLCFTDHMDMADEHTGHARSSLAERLPRFLCRREEYALSPVEGIEVRFGMELGEPLQSLSEAERAASAPGLDLVIGSIHNLPDTPDFYFLAYESEAHCRELNHRYLAALRDMAALSCFDVMAHIGYTSRYMNARGFRERLTLNGEYGSELEEILRRLIERGRGIELNLSGFRNGGHDTYPDAAILRRYRELGGEILTVGSDGHIPADASRHIRLGYALAEECGFRYITEFRRRKPEFVPLA